MSGFTFNRISGPPIMKACITSLQPSCKVLSAVHYGRFVLGSPIAAAVSSDCSATTDCTTFFYFFHHTWPFLLPTDRRRCQLSSPPLLQYSFQRVHVAVTSVASLRAPRPSPTKPHSIDRIRTRLFGSALLRFDFIHGDLIRWLAGEHTPTGTAIGPRLFVAFNLRLE